MSEREIDALVATDMALEIVHCGNGRTALHTLRARQGREGARSRHHRQRRALGHRRGAARHPARHRPPGLARAGSSPRRRSAWPPATPRACTGCRAGVIAPGREADLCIVDAPIGSVGPDRAARRCRAGDLFGISMVLIDGQIRIGRSRNTPPGRARGRGGQGAGPGRGRALMRIRKLVTVVEEILEDGGQPRREAHQEGGRGGGDREPVRGALRRGPPGADQDRRGARRAARAARRRRRSARPCTPTARRRSSASDGEYEHAAAILHPTLGTPFRAAVGGGKAIIPSAKKLGGPGTPIDVPLHYKDAAFVRTHFDAMEVRVAGRAAGERDPGRPRGHGRRPTASPRGRPHRRRGQEGGRAPMRAGLRLPSFALGPRTASLQRWAPISAAPRTWASTARSPSTTSCSRRPPTPARGSSRWRCSRRWPA